MIVRQAQDEDGLFIAPHVRAADAREIKASHGLGDGFPSLGQLLVACIHYSADAWVAVDKAGYLALGGASAAAVEGVGIPWMVATDRASPLFFMRSCKQFEKKLFEKYHTLTNFVDCRNTASIQWLHRMGYLFADVAPYYGRARIPFLQFYKSK
jgi:tetrahydromethanopterin S-methyltransferase subunit C